MKKKTEMAKEFWQDGDYKSALRILKTFTIGIDEALHEIFDKGYEAMVHPQFYSQIHGEQWCVDMAAAAKEAVDNYFTRWD